MTATELEQSSTIYMVVSSPGTHPPVPDAGHALQGAGLEQISQASDDAV